jgi:hypothetical protein
VGAVDEVTEAGSRRFIPRAGLAVRLAGSSALANSAREMKRAREGAAFGDG